MAGEDRELEERIARELEGISPRRQALDRGVLAFLVWGLDSLIRHWLLIANAINGVIVVGAVAVPLLRAAGHEALGAQLFALYHWLCLQDPGHSYFVAGHQFAMDHRMMAIYGASLAFGLLYLPRRGRVRPLSWRGYFVLILPIALDGFTQLLGWRESDWALRTSTGALFGAATVWLAYPYLDLALESATRPRTAPGG